MYKPKVREKVTCKHEVHAYYSAYGGNPAIVFKPGMVAEVVYADSPKVCIVGEPPIYDRRKTSLVCDYLAPETGRIQRVSLNYCNAELVK
jgi:hypothetical protein